MPLIYKHGDLTKSTDDIIVHGCNAQGKMASGVAKAVRAAFPNAYDSYHRAYLKQNCSLLVGDVVWARATSVDGNPLFIANAITQEFYGRDGKQYVDYDAITEVFTTIHGVATEIMTFDLDRPATVGIPRIGASLGGGDWAIISKLVEAAMGDLQVTVYIPEEMDLPTTHADVYPFADPLNYL